MKTLVTGGAGFIGSNLVDSLVEAGHSVVVVDNLTTGHRHNLRPEATLHALSVDDPALLNLLQGIEVVFHLAAQIDVRKSVEDPVHDAGINIIAGLKMLDMCRRAGVKKVVYSSTGGALYGEPGAEHLPAGEDTPIRPLSGYGVSKHTFEHYLELYHQLYGLEFTALRYGNVYGPRQDPMGEAGVVAIFCNRILDGKQPIIFGDGKQTRDYVFVKDVCRANLLAMQSGNGQILNIGTGLETSVLDLVEALQAALGQKVEPIFEPARPGEVLRIALDSSRAAQLLGWRAEVTLADGIARTIAFQKSAVPN